MCMMLRGMRMKVIIRHGFGLISRDIAVYFDSIGLVQARTQKLSQLMETYTRALPEL